MAHRKWMYLAGTTAVACSLLAAPAQALTDFGVTYTLTEMVVSPTMDDFTLAITGIPPFAGFFSKDAILFATPEYNSSIPGQLKNAIDWASRPVSTAALRNKPVAVIGASTGSFGAVWSQAELRKVLGSAGARVIDRALPVPSADEAFHQDGSLIDDDTTLELGSVIAELLDSARQRLAA